MIHAKSYEAAEMLVHRIANGSGLGTDANELLKCFFRGFPLDRLRELLKTNNPEVVGVGTWIASELGTKARPILDEVPPLIRHPARKVRFFAIDVVLTCAGKADGELLALTALLGGDAEAEVRWKALHFLIALTPVQLASAIEYCENRGGVLSELASGLGLVQQFSSRRDSIVASFDSDSKILVACALAAAVRISREDRAPLKAAMNSPDATVRAVALEELEKLDS